jgi:hypothetical protein
VFFVLISFLQVQATKSGVPFWTSTCFAREYVYLQV